MIGRAGRYGFDTEADSILCCYPTEKTRAVELMTRKLERVESCLKGSQRGLSRVILEAVGIGLVQNAEQMQSYLMSTLLYTQAKYEGDEGLQSPMKADESFRKSASRTQDEADTSKERADKAWRGVQSQGKEALDFLIFNEIINQSPCEGGYSFEATKLGMAIIKSNLSAEEGLMVYLDL